MLSYLLQHYAWYEFNRYNRANGRQYRPAGIILTSGSFCQEQEHRAEITAMVTAVMEQKKAAAARCLNECTMASSALVS